MASEVRFYADEHIARAVVRGLRARGIDVLTAVDAAMLSAPDEQHLRRASVEGRVVVRQDDDFLKLHATGVDHAAIAYASQQTSIGRMLSGLVLIHQVLTAEEMKDHVEFL